jgi:glutathione S-transferase
VRYLAASYGDGSLWPADPAERSQSDRWMDWTLADLQPTFIGGVFWNFYRTPAERRNWPAIRQALSRCASLFQLLDRHLAETRFIAADRLTIGDIATGVQLYRYFELEVERPALPHVEAWYGRLKERPAYREHVMVPFDDLRGRLAF